MPTRLATVLSIDYGESEQQSVDSFMELPVQFRDLEPLAERVKLEVDKGLNMMMNDKSEAMYWENGQKIEFSDLNPQTCVGGGSS